MAQQIPYESHLNAAQLDAVTYYGSPLLVLAGAGSGKTRVITYKIAYLINEMSIDPKNILAVTFTNKASEEMKERVDALLGEKVEVWIRTFHSTAARVLRIMGDAFGIQRRFTIIDQQDQKMILRKIMKEMNLDQDTYKPEKYAALIDRAKDRLLSAEEAESERFSTDPLFFDIYGEYERRLNHESLFDFGDLIFRLCRGLDSNGDALNLVKQRFRYILVDEFQDTNHAQYDLIKKLTFPDGNIYVVGDEDQSIYGFRGAVVENIMNFSKEYAHTKIIKLEENYRSFQTILSASSHLIDKNSGRFGKTLFTRKGEGEKIVFFHAASDRGEARFIADRILRLRYDEGYGFSDIAVFYRMNAQSRVFESVFSEMGIPYSIVGGFRFYEREEIKDILAYVRILVNPYDEVSLRRIANKPVRGIGEKTVDALVRCTIGCGRPFFHIECGLEVSPSRKKKVESFVGSMEKLRELVDSTYPSEFLRTLFETSGYLDYLKGTGNEEKMRNIDELYNAVEEFSKQNPSAPISEFVEEVSLNQNNSDEGFEQERTFLITLHNAKGLEFPVVFIAGMEEGIFPHYLAGEQVSELQEERRLCYVGMTRAMEKLYFTAARVRKLYGASVERGISKFLLELPQELIMFSEEKPEQPSISGLTGPSFRRHRTSSGPGYLQGRKTPERRSAHPAEISDLKTSSRVIHPQFGTGTVVEISGEVAVIQFDDGNKMMFMLNYTPLRKEEEERRDA
jgi:DNA helicase-2/ATP-dependent DNA helicase PcrA